MQLAPRRSEFFTTPGQEFDYQDWLNSLAVHELRHVVQFDKLTGRLRPPFEGLALAIFGVTLPPWFYEGDAVITETSLTRAGRGRQPEFDLVLRANTRSGRRYSYSKDYLGSYKNFVSDYYPLGYEMTKKLEDDFGRGIVDSIVTRIARNPLRPYNFTSSVKKFTGISTAGLHAKTIDEIGRRTPTVTARNYPQANPPHPGQPVSYFLPVSVTGDGIAALRKGLGKVPALVSIDGSGHERVLRRIGIQEEEWFKYAAGKFVWDEFRYDARYHKRSYNVLMLMDARTGKTTQITHKTRLFAPALSPQGERISAVDVDYSNRISLVILNTLGHVSARFASPANCMLQTPAWRGDGQKIVVTGVTDKGKTLFELDVRSGTFTQLFPFQEQLISRPAYLDDGRVAYKAHYNGIDNIYVFDLDKRSFGQLTEVEFGAYSPSYDSRSGRMLFNTYGPDGMNIASTPVKAALVSLPTDVAPTGESVFDSIPQRILPTKPYREAANLFYVHSLVPIIGKNDVYDATDYGLKLQSDNKLNTLSGYAGYRFNTTLHKNEYLAGLRYSRFFPVVELTYENTARFARQETAIGGGVAYSPINWRQHAWEFKTGIPLLMNSGPYTYSLYGEVGTGLVSRYAVRGNPIGFPTSLRFPMLYRVSFGRNVLRCARDLAPRWGQNVEVRYRDLPFETRLDGHLFTLKSNFYLPGFADNHSLQLSFNVQNAQGAYAGTDDIPTVAGYASLPYTGVLRNTLLTAYRFPLVYPDWEIGSLAYVKRLRGGVFADFQDIAAGNSFTPRAFGVELKGDVNLLRFYLPEFTFGAKMIFTNSSQVPSLFQAGLSYSY